MGKLLCTEHIDPDVLSAFVARGSFLLTNHQLGVQPIGVGALSRQIISKAILKFVGSDIGEATGCLQTCAGYSNGCVAAIHAMNEVFNNLDTEATLLIDAENAFNSIKRQTALANINKICPSIYRLLHNTYQAPIRMFIHGGGEIMSCKGTTQGDPLAMAMYALAVTPLIKMLCAKYPDVTEAWFADDATGAGKISLLRSWWDASSSVGPKFGYYPNAKKTPIIVEEEYKEEAECIFADVATSISTKGNWLLGGAIGSRNFIEDFVNNKVSRWVDEVRCLAEIPNPSLR